MRYSNTRPQEFILNQQHPLAKGLVVAGLGQFPKSNLYKDATCFKNDASQSGSPLPSNWRWVSKLGRWFFYTNRNTNSVVFPYHASMYDANNMAVALWVKFDSADFSGGAGYILSQYQHATNQRQWSLISSTASPGRLSIVASSDGTSGAGKLHIVNSTYSVPTVYTHVVVNIRGRRYYDFYIDGVFSQTLDLTATYVWQNLGSAFHTSLVGGMANRGPKAEMADIFLRVGRLFTGEEIRILANPADPMLGGLIQPIHSRPRYYVPSSGSTYEVTGESFCWAVPSGSITARRVVDGDAFVHAVPSGEITAKRIVSGDSFVWAVPSGDVSAKRVVTGDAYAWAVASGDVAAKRVGWGDSFLWAVAEGDVTTNRVIDGDAYAWAVPQGDITASRIVSGDAFVWAVASGDIKISDGTTTYPITGETFCWAVPSSPDLAVNAAIGGNALAWAVPSGSITARCVVDGDAFVRAVPSGEITAKRIVSGDSFAWAFGAGNISANKIIDIDGESFVHSIPEGSITANRIVDGESFVHSIPEGSITANRIVDGDAFVHSVTTDSISIKRAITGTEKYIWAISSEEINTKLKVNGQAFVHAVGSYRDYDVLNVSGNAFSWAVSSGEISVKYKVNGESFVWAFGKYILPVHSFAFREINLTGKFTVEKELMGKFTVEKELMGKI